MRLQCSNVLAIFFPFELILKAALNVSEFMIVKFLWTDLSEEVGIEVIEGAKSEELGGNGEETAVSE